MLQQNNRWIIFAVFTSNLATLDHLELRLCLRSQFILALLQCLAVHIV